jgi:NAD+--dinitrogen-reductase ADP-D-ribosyltransferase
MAALNSLQGADATHAKDDKHAALCRGVDNDAASSPSLPKWARLPINRCNLPAVILGSLTFQRHPTELLLDGVAELHADQFERLDNIDDQAARAEAFCDYMKVSFRLDHLDEAGLDDASPRRANANWIRFLRGWSFNADGREGAALKGWVESRFGLLPRFHGEPLRDFVGPAYRRYQEMRADGLYGTNALESQFDLVYAYAQYEFRRAARRADGITLYRGINRISEHEVLSGQGRRQVVLFNNLTSFTSSRERAGEFGDYILETRVPPEKIFFHCRLIGGVLKGEDEYLVIGGAYEVDIGTM